MRWTLAGCCGLALVTLSVGQISQWPRFYGVRVGQTVKMYCKSLSNTSTSWHKTKEYDVNKMNNMSMIEVQGTDERIQFGKLNKTAFLKIDKLQTEDSGVYFCQTNNVYGPGTALQVVRIVDPVQAQYRSKVKDVLMVLQGLLLAICVAAILLRQQKVQVKRRDSLYEEPENDHIYEGLAIETCGGDLYEDLSAYAQPEGAEAPWE